MWILWKFALFIVIVRCWPVCQYIHCITRYLQEIGYTDTIIDVRSARVRQLLGLQPHNNENDNDNHQLVNGEQSGKRPADSQGRRYVFDPGQTGDPFWSCPKICIRVSAQLHDIKHDGTLNINLPSFLLLLRSILEFSLCHFIWEIFFSSR